MQLSLVQFLLGIFLLSACVCSCLTPQTLTHVAWWVHQVAQEKQELERDISLVRAPAALLQRQAAEREKVLVPVEAAPQQTEERMAE
jgi:hypothetical protein